MQEAAYTYDGDGNMVKGVVNGVETYYPGRHYNEEVDGSTSTVKKFYTMGSTTVAVRTVSETEDVLNWVLGDHLGSASVTANVDGSWNSEIKYTAFGEVRSNSGLTPTEYRYTGQLEQNSLGLYFYVARWYDPYLNQFVQPDSIIPEPANAVTWNRYAYANYNPINFNDPSGHAADAGGGAASIPEEVLKKLEYRQKIFEKYGASGDPSILHYADVGEPMLDGFFDGLQHNWDYIVRDIVPKNWTWSTTVIIPPGYGITDEVIEYSLDARLLGYGFGDLSNNAVLKGIGLLVTCWPAQEENRNTGDTSFADITGDLAVDTTGFVVSEAVGYIALAGASETGPGALAAKLLVDVAVGTIYNFVVAQTGLRETTVEWIERKIKE